MDNIPQYAPDETQDEFARMQGLIEFLSAYIEQYHGGSAQLLGFDGKTVEVRMGGACIGCPLSPHTLKGWIEGTVRQFFPEIEEVVAIADDEAEPNLSIS